VSKIVEAIKRYFISGVLVVVPLILTYIVLRFLFEAIDGVLQPLIFRVFGFYVPGLGVVTTLILILVAGMFTRNLIGHRAVKMGERVLARMPIVRPIYSSAKQLLEAMTSSTSQSFKEVGIIEYPRRGLYSLGFIARRFPMEIDGNRKWFVSILIASTPTPVSGMVVMVPEEEVYRINMTVEDGLKFLVSGGVVTPDMITHRTPKLRTETEEVDE
jgi:uncharacterized membrane protein